jgi:inorganic pyrophosphatase
MVDRGQDDYKVIAVAHDKHYDHVQSVEDLSMREKEDIEYFMLHYKDLDKQVVTLDGWDGPEETKKIIKHSIKHYNMHNLYKSARLCR